MRSKEHFQFEHEKNKRPETKVPKYKPKHDLVKAKNVVSQTTQTGSGTPIAQTLGGVPASPNLSVVVTQDMPADVLQPSTYTPLLISPTTASSSSVSSHLETQQQFASVIAQVQAQGIPVDQIPSASTVSPRPRNPLVIPSTAGEWSNIPFFQAPQQVQPPTKKPKKQMMNTPWGPLSPLNTMDTPFTPLRDRIPVTSPIESFTQTDFPRSPLEEHPDFFEKFTGVQAYERAQAEEAVANATAELEAKNRNLATQLALKTDFINTFMYSKFKVPFEMGEELNTIMQLAQKVELDSKGRVRTDSEYNFDLFRDLNEWMDRAVQAGMQIRNVSISDWTRFLEDRKLGIRSKGGVSKKTKDKIKVLKKGLQDEKPPSPTASIMFEPPANRLLRGNPPLRIYTDVPRRRGPRAPRTATQPEPDTSQITAANILPGKRRRR